MARVLLIEDDASVRDTMARVLARAGHEVVEASGGAEGIATYTADPTDVVITDINMPGMDGIEVITSFRKSGSPVPIIAISGGGIIAKDILLSSAFALGAVEVISKPFGLSQLAGAVDRALAPVAR